MSPRRAVAMLAVALAWAAGIAAGAQSLPAVALETLAADLGRLSSVTHAGDERLFVTTLDGRILVWGDGAVRASPFLDISSRVTSGGERGFFSAVFHPRFPVIPFLFVNYTDTGGDTVIARYRVNSERVRPRSGRVVLHIPQPFANHNGGQLQFGPDGYLYVGMGDGGDGNDPRCNAQGGANLLGKMLRLDVDDYRRRGPKYRVPGSNPFARGGRFPPEVWAFGLRNPWRFSFDRDTGDLYIADVGQGAREEINFQSAASPGGENYGWARQEGTLCLNQVSACEDVPPCGSPELVQPILEYPLGSGTCAVIGGYVYRGAAIPGLVGAYVFGDFCAGTLWGAVRGDDGGFDAVALGPTVDGLTSFGEDAAGELYTVSTRGVLQRLVAQ